LGEWVQGNGAKHQTIQFVGTFGGGIIPIRNNTYSLSEILYTDWYNTIMNQLTQAYEHAGVDYAFLTYIDSAITW
jgi:hypothetical protein